MSMAPPTAAPAQDDDMQTFEHFASDPAQVGEARRFVLRHLDPAHPRYGDLAVCASEVITNAVVHPAGDRRKDGVNVAVHTDHGEVVVSVTDGGGGTVPTIVRGNETKRLNGRGMLLVDVLADEWGFSRTPEGATHVWFAIRTSLTLAAGG